MVRAYELLAAQCDYPLHLGVTEAGPAFQGTIKSAVAFGALLSQGIGDTIRVSLSAPPVEEVKVGNQILESLNLRQRGLEIVSCPSCGRAQVDVYTLAEEVTAGLEGMEVPLRVAVMGCVVNGPGEAREADLGVASGNGKGQIFVKGEVIKTVPESQIVETLIEEAMRIAERAGRPAGHAVRAARRQRQLTAPGPRPVLRTPTARVLDEADEAAVHRLLATDPVAACVLAGRVEAAGTAAGVAGRAAVGLRRGARARRGLPGRRQPDPLRRPRRRARRRGRLRRAGPPGRPPLLDDRRPGRRRSAPLWELLAPHWGPARDHRPRQPLMAIDGPPGGRGRAAGAAGPAGRAGDPAARRGRDVHRGGRRQPAAGRRRRRLPRPGRRAGAGRAVAGLDRGRRGALQGRDRRRLPRRLPGAGRLGRAGPPRPGHRRRRAPRPSSSTPARRSRRWSASTSTTSTPPARAAYRRVGFREVGQYASVLF